MTPLGEKGLLSKRYAEMAKPGVSGKVLALRRLG